MNTIAAVTASPVKPPGLIWSPFPGPGWTALHPGWHFSSYLVGEQPVSAATVAQADYDYGSFYGARARLNLTLGSGIPKSAFTSLDDAVKAAQMLSKGARPALAVVQRGAELILRNVQRGLPASPYAAPTTTLTTGMHFLHTGDARSWNDRQASLNGVRFMNLAVRAFVDGDEVIRNPKPVRTPA